MTAWKEPTREEQEASAERAERRELQRLHNLANECRSLVQHVDDALTKCTEATTVYEAVSHLRGAASTFSRALIAVVGLA